MIRTALIFLALTAPALAQSPELAASLALEECAQQKAVEFAVLDATMAEIAAAAMSACGEHRQALKSAFADHYRTLGANEGLALSQAEGTADHMASIVEQELLAVIAETKLAQERH